MRPIFAVVATACLFASQAVGATLPTRIESPVFQTTGSHQDITKRAAICMAQLLRPGFVTAPVLVVTDAEAGIVVANNEFVYRALPLFPADIRSRTTLTLQAKDGRFKLVHSNIEQYNEQHGSTAKAWERLSDSDAAKAIDALSLSVAHCVQQAPIDDSW